MPAATTTRTAFISALLLSIAPGVAVGQLRTGAADTLVVEAPNGPWSLKRGERVRGTTEAGRLIEGRVLAQSDSDLVIGGRTIWRNVPGESNRVRYAELVRIEAHRPPRHRSTAMTIGVVGGIAVGAYLGTRSVHRTCSAGDIDIAPCISRGTAAIFGGALGMGLGAGTAYLASRPRWHLLSVTRRVGGESTTPR